jgi:hypothetical protein
LKPPELDAKKPNRANENGYAKQQGRRLVVANGTQADSASRDCNDT